MSRFRITETDIFKALDWLRDNADEAAQAKANRVHLEEMRKHLKAVLMKENASLPLAAQEREAYADPRYLIHLDGLKQAVFEEARLMNLRTAAEAKVSAWQTQEANNRAVTRSL